VILKVIQGGVGFGSGTEASSPQNVTQSLLPFFSLSSSTVWWHLQLSIHCVWEGSGRGGTARRRGGNSHIHRAVLSVQHEKAL